MTENISNSQLLLAILCLVSTLGGQQLSAKSANTAPCNLVVVSKWMSNNNKTCDDATVLRFAREGQVYEQNQLGIASVLALRPGASSRDALKWFEKAALRGYAPAQVNLAVMYANGWGTPRNYGAALEWLKAASEQHYARADYNLGILYMQGTGVRRDYVEALRWFQMGAEAGDSSAETNLGYLYDQGLGVGRNATTATYWYTKAAKAGNPLGEYNLADMYLRGAGVNQSDWQALHWFQKASEQGHTGAQIKLAYMYSQGRGLKADPEYAYALVTAAALAGDDRGRELLSSLEGVLSPQQISTAKARAATLQSSSRSMIDLAYLAP